jgi:energy-coupling factor transporter ATP-binding protein EcfA2
MSITFPGRAPGEAPVVLEGSRFVIIGANGSGKTRLGIWLEQHNQRTATAHRISAHRALTVPEFAKVLNLEQAEKNLILGTSASHASIERKIHDRWGNAPATYLLSDYEKLLALLFAKSAERDRLHTEQTRREERYVPVSEAPIDLIIEIWKDLMPHRSLSLLDGKVLVDAGAASGYHGKEMSDGERVALYLIGQCLVAPDGSILIIDEPELHLHKALMDKLWNKVEELCPHKTIVYITHDLDFAASRADATKVWTQEYSAAGWTWMEVPAGVDLPETLVLEILGNRKPILFCEGDLDHTIYQLCLPEVHVVSRGGSEKVIEATKALRDNTALHPFIAKGIIDRDVRGEFEISALSRNGVYVLGYAEIENLLCTDAVIRSVAVHLELDPDSLVEKVKTFIISSLRNELEAQSVIRAERRIRYELSTYSKVSPNEAALRDGLDALLSRISISDVYSESKRLLTDALETDDLNAILKVYNRKSLPDQISSLFGLGNRQYIPLVVRLLKSDRSGPLIMELKAALPDFDFTSPHSATRVVPSSHSTEPFPGEKPMFSSGALGGEL